MCVVLKCSTIFHRGTSQAPTLPPPPPPPQRPYDVFRGQNRYVTLPLIVAENMNFFMIFHGVLRNLVLKFHAKLAKSLVPHRHPSLQVVAALFLIRERASYRFCPRETSYGRWGWGGGIGACDVSR